MKDHDCTRTAAIVTMLGVRLGTITEIPEDRPPPRGEIDATFRALSKRGMLLPASCSECGVQLTLDAERAATSLLA